MASDFNVKQHDLREVEYNIYEDPIFKTTFAQLSVSDIKDGKGKIHTYDGEDAEMIYDILVGKFDAGKRISELNKVISDKDNTITNQDFYIHKLEEDLNLERKKYADLERDYQYYVKDKNEKFNKLEKYINELEDTIHKERKKYNEATKLNDDLHKDLAHWKQMYEEVYKVYNHEVDIQHENEGLIAENKKLKKDAEYFADEYKKCVKILNEKENNYCDNSEKLRHENLRLQDEINRLDRVNRELKSELARAKGVIECQEIAHNYRYLKSENDKLRTDLAGAFEDVKKLSDERAYLIKRQDELTFENAALRDNAKCWRERYEELEKKRATWRENQDLKKELAEETAARKALNERCQELEKEYVACMDTIKAQQRAVSDLNSELKSLKNKQAKSIIDFGRLVAENEGLNRAHQDLMNDVANSNRVIERLKKEIERLEKEPKYMQISGLRAGSMALKLMGENHKLRKERDGALEALSEKNFALAEAQIELMKRRRCCGCPFRG